MQSNTQNVPDAIRQEAKQKALTVLKSDPSCISFVRPEDLETAALFIPVVSIIKPTKDDFYDPIPLIGIMAKPPLVNLIAEKAGIEIIRTETSKRSEYVYIAHCFGRKRQPDGTMRTDDASYEFDVEKRAELDAINQPEKYGTEIGKRKHLLETAKFGEQRAVTGAQFALIHKLAHISRSFKTPDELMRGMMVLRIDRNVNGVLADPGLRQAALGQMLGATETVFGPQPPKQVAADEHPETPPEETSQPVPRTGDPETGEIIEPQVDEKGQGELWLSTDPSQPKHPTVEELKAQLREYLGKRMPQRAVLEINQCLENAEATVEAVNLMIDRCNAYIQKRAEAKKGATA